MYTVFLHGLGQDSHSFEKVIFGIKKDYKIYNHKLFDFQYEKLSYDLVYKNFCDIVENINSPFNICGLSLGGVLALQYALENPEKVNNLILIGAQYKIPKLIMKIQCGIFRFMKNEMFEELKVSKKDFITLMKSMENIDFSLQLKNIKCKTLVLCGEKDKANIKASRDLYKKIQNSKLVILKDVGHLVNEKKPKELSNEINIFLKEVIK